MSVSLPSSSPLPESAITDDRRAPGNATQVGGRLRSALWPLGLYLVLSIGLFGIPVIGHLGSHIIAVNDQDPSVNMWFLGWWPHALLHGLNPFVTHAMFYPDGYNLTWAASMPLPSLVLAPITLTVGPVVSWNVLQLLSPALSSWTAFLLCRHVTVRPLPSLIGGYVFGFSPYMLAHLQTSPNLGLVALLPVLVLLVLKHIEGSTTPRRFVITMTLALAAQFLISTEVLATSTLFGGFALLAAFVLFKDHRQKLLQTIKLLAFAYLATAVLVSPYLYYFVFGHHYPPGVTLFETDLTAYVLPPATVALQPHGSPIVGSNVEVYLGVPLLLLIVVFLWQRRRSPMAVLLMLGMLAPAVASLGGLGLDVRGHVTFMWLPWRLFANLPVLRYAIPARFSVFVILPAAMIVALWLSDHRPPAADTRRRQVARWGLALLAVAFIVPDVGNRAWNTPIADPAFFQHDTYRHYLTSNDHVLTIPAWGPSQRWIADAGFPFTLSAGSGGQGFPAGYARYPIWNTLVNAPPRLPTGYASQLQHFLTAKDVTAIVVQQGFPGPWTKLFATLGVRPVTTGGVLLYRLGPRRAQG